MRNCTMIVFFIFFPMFLFAQVEGYKDLKWGASTSDVIKFYPNLKIKNKMAKGRYKCEKEYTSRGEGVVSDRTFIFCDGKLSLVTVNYNIKKLALNKVLGKFTAIYGENYRTTETEQMILGTPYKISFIIWYSEKTEIRLTESTSKIRPFMAAVYISSEIREQEEEKLSSQFEF